MTGSRKRSALPQSICTITVLEKAPQPHQTIPIADLSVSAEVLHRVRTGIKTVSSSLALRALRLDPGPYPMPPTRRPKISNIPGHHLS
jgi:hypothetical protein